MEEIKKFPLYDLEWLIKLVRPISTSVKAFWLFRNFPNLVASHSTWDGGFRKHAQVMATYLEYIAHTMPHFIPRNDWVRIDYEHVDSDIAPVMHSLGAFLGWKAEWQQVAKGITIQQSSRNATATLVRTHRPVRVRPWSHCAARCVACGNVRVRHWCALCTRTCRFGVARSWVGAPSFRKGEAMFRGAALTRRSCFAVLPAAVQPQEKLDYVQTLVANFTKTKRWSQAVFDTTQRLLKRYPA